MNINSDDKFNQTRLDDQTLQNCIDDLPKEIAPERDLWKGIEHAIEHKQQSSFKFESEKKSKSNNLVFSWAASVIAAVLVTWLTLEPQQAKMSNEINLVSSMQQSFEAQKKGLLVSFGTAVDKPLSKEMLAQLTQLSSARQSISKALVEDPNNSDLINLLHWTQQQELDLLEQLYRPTWQSI